MANRLLYFTRSVILLTKEQIANLKPGDLLKDLTDNDKEFALQDFTLGEYNGRPIIYIMFDKGNSNSLALPYYYDELELVSDCSGNGKCTCDFYKVILVTGCKCGGK